MTVPLPEPQLDRLHLFGKGPEIEAAYDEWGANCGPLAIAAATGRSLADVRAALTNGTGRFKGYTNVPDTQAALRWLDVKVVRTWSRPPNSLLERDLTTGPAIFVIQWGGPWMRDPRAAARHRHLIAFRYGWIGPAIGPRWVADVNIPNVWCLLDGWLEVVPPLLAPEGGDGTWSTGGTPRTRDDVYSRVQRKGLAKLSKSKSACVPTALTPLGHAVRDHIYARIKDNSK